METHMGCKIWKHMDHIGRKIWKHIGHIERNIWNPLDDINAKKVRSMLKVQVNLTGNLS